MYHTASVSIREPNFPKPVAAAPATVAEGEISISYVRQRAGSQVSGSVAGVGQAKWGAHARQVERAGKSSRHGISIWR